MTVHAPEVAEGTSRCKRCRRPIELRTFGAKNWEPDYDPGSDPVVWRHASGYASCGRGSGFAEPGAPDIVVLCGSTRFRAEFEDASRRLGLAGKIVLSVSMFGHSGDLPAEHCMDGHPVKIDLADTVLVINPGGYIGASTRSEIDYAEALGKPVTYLVTAHSLLGPHCAVCGTTWPPKAYGLCTKCHAGLPCRADTTDLVAPDPPCAGSRLASPS
ncbi:MAG: hypothetical protein JWO15_3728 [Sphingomonadales bacterium]|nr:hypothetical protein [Sphingomonadales bacterium]